MSACHLLAQARPHDVVHLTSLFTSREIRGKVKHAPRKGEGFHCQTNLSGSTSHPEQLRFLLSGAFPVNWTCGKSLYRHYSNHCEPQSTINRSHPILRRNITVGWPTAVRKV